MVNAFIRGCLLFVFDILRFFTGLVTEPFYNFIRLWFPDIQIYSNNVATFLNTYVFRGLAFSRELFLNFTGLPRALYEVIIFYLLGAFTFYLSISGFLFICNVFRGWKRGI